MERITQLADFDRDTIKDAVAILDPDDDDDE